MLFVPTDKIQVQSKDTSVLGYDATTNIPARGYSNQSYQGHYMDKPFHNNNNYKILDNLNN